MWQEFCKMWMASMYRVMQAESTKICGHVARVICSKKRSQFVDPFWIEVLTIWKYGEMKAVKSNFTVTLKFITEVGVPVANLLKMATCDSNAYLIMAHY